MLCPPTLGYVAHVREWTVDRVFERFDEEEDSARPLWFVERRGRERIESGVS